MGPEGGLALVEQVRWWTFRWLERTRVLRLL